MNADQLRQKAKEILNGMLLPNIPTHDGISIGLSGVDEFVDLLVDAAVAEIRENHQVDVPNTGYYGVIVKKESPT